MNKADNIIKQEIVNFLRSGGTHINLSCKTEQYIKKVPFLSAIVGSESYPDTLMWNNNWFWLPSNKDNRLALASDVEGLNSFSLKDEDFAYITVRVMADGGYGIQMPVPRPQEEPFDAEIFDEAFEWYVIRKEKIRFEKHIFRNSHYKIVYCRKRELPFSTVKGWNRCELILGEALNYAEYKAVQDFIYGEPDELKDIYMSEEYLEAKENMLNGLIQFRKNRSRIANECINSIKNSLAPIILTSEYIAEATKSFHKLVELYEAPEGASEDVKNRLTRRKQAVINLLTDEEKNILGV